MLLLYKFIIIIFSIIFNTIILWYTKDSQAYCMYEAENENSIESYNTSHNTSTIIPKNMSLKDEVELVKKNPDLGYKIIAQRLADNTLNLQKKTQVENIGCGFSFDDVPLTSWNSISKVTTNEGEFSYYIDSSFFTPKVFIEGVDMSTHSTIKPRELTTNEKLQLSHVPIDITAAQTFRIYNQTLMDKGLIPKSDVNQLTIPEQFVSEFVHNYESKRHAGKLSENDLMEKKSKALLHFRNKTDLRSKLYLKLQAKIESDQNNNNINNNEDTLKALVLKKMHERTRLTNAKLNEPEQPEPNIKKETPNIKKETPILPLETPILPSAPILSTLYPNLDNVNFPQIPLTLQNNIKNAELPKPSAPSEDLLLKKTIQEEFAQLHGFDKFKKLNEKPTGIEVPDITQFSTLPQKQHPADAHKTMLNFIKTKLETRIMQIKQDLLKLDVIQKNINDIQQDNIKAKQLLIHAKEKLTDVTTAWYNDISIKSLIIVALGLTTLYLLFMRYGWVKYLKKIIMIFLTNGLPILNNIDKSFIIPKQNNKESNIQSITDSQIQAKNVFNKLATLLEIPEDYRDYNPKAKLKHPFLKK